MSVQAAIHNLQEAMRQEGISPEKGLGDSLFLFASTLLPIVNVDILALNKKGEFLLSWRDDPHCGTGWHIPGGCIRFRESIMERAQKTAIREFGCQVLLVPVFLHTFEIFVKDDRMIQNQNERSHNITFVMMGIMPDDFCIEKQLIGQGEPGYLQWFSELPENLLSVQDCYKKHWQTIQEKLKGKVQNGHLEE